MNVAPWTCMLLSIAALTGDETIHVAVCNPGHLPDGSVRRAEASLSAVFHRVGVEVVQAKCGSGPVSEEAMSRHWFTIRLRADRPPSTPSPVSLDMLGRAFVGPEGGYMADVYYRVVQSLAARTGSDADAVIGCVMAHELGHLLLGPGHVPDGIMRASWSTGDLEAIRKRWLLFDRAQNAGIRRELRG